MSAVTICTRTVLILISVLIGAQSRESCDNIFTGQIFSIPDCSNGHDAAEINPNCRIDLGVNPVSTVAITSLSKALNSKVKLCFGCSEHNLFGQCNTVIACHLRAVCFNETHFHDGHVRHTYGCMWGSNHITVQGHHCDQPENLETSGIRTCHHANLCNGNSPQLKFIGDLLNTLHTSTTTSTETPTTTVPSTTPAPSTPSPTTTATAEPSTIHTSPSALLSSPCTLGNGTLMCVNKEDPPYFTCKQADQDIGLCSWTSSLGHDRVVNDCPLYCGFCDEFCQKLYYAQVTTTMTPTTTATPSTTMPSTTTTTTPTTTATPSTTMPSTTTTTTPTTTATPSTTMPSTTTTTTPTTTATPSTTQTTTTPTTMASTPTSTQSTTTTTTAPTQPSTTETPSSPPTTTVEPSTTITTTASSTPPCFDKDVTCPNIGSFLCPSTDPVSVAYAKQNCAKTCNFCGQTSN